MLDDDDFDTGLLESDGGSAFVCGMVVGIPTFLASYEVLHELPLYKQVAAGFLIISGLASAWYGSAKAIKPWLKRDAPEIFGNELESRVEE